MTITAPGWINMDSGALEYLAVTEYGKTHESVLVLDVVPLHLQIALLLMGLEYGQNLSFQGDTVRPIGDSLDIFVGWQEGQKPVEYIPATDLIYDRYANSIMSETPWVFSGSYISQSGFMADVDGSIIAIYSDPVAILNNPLSGRMDDSYYQVNSRRTPEQGTDIMFKIVIPHK
jgi:hypothetical protein